MTRLHRRRPLATHERTRAATPDARFAKVPKQLDWTALGEAIKAFRQLLITIGLLIIAGQAISALTDGRLDVEDLTRILSGVVKHFATK